MKLYKYIFFECIFFTRGVINPYKTALIVIAGFTIPPDTAPKHCIIIIIASPELNAFRYIGFIWLESQLIPAETPTNKSKNVPRNSAIKIDNTSTVFIFKTAKQMY